MKKKHAANICHYVSAAMPKDSANTSLWPILQHNKHYTEHVDHILQRGKFNSGDIICLKGCQVQDLFMET